MGKNALAVLRHELRVYHLLLRDPRTPRIAKWLPGFDVGYLVMPFDIVPDFIPVLGQLDDLITIPLVIFIALKLIPKGVIDDCRLGAVPAMNSDSQQNRVTGGG